MLIPYSVDSYLKRKPWVTLSIVATTLLLYFLQGAISPSWERIEQAQAEVRAYYQTHPYLERIADFLRPRLSADARQAQRDSRTAEQLASEQTELNRLVAAYEDLLFTRAEYVFGFTGFGKPWGLLTYLLVHAGLFHVVGNMLFLYVMGSALEDLWGHRVILGIYFAGGLFAVLVHALVGSTIPVVGTSGAVACVMGAFLVRLYRLRLGFAFMFLYSIVRPNVYIWPAIAVLPLWLVKELLLITVAKSGDLTFIAHVLSFALGSGVALVLIRTQFEKQFMLDEQVREESTDYTSFKQAERAFNNYQYQKALEHVTVFLKSNPSDVPALLLYARSQRRLEQDFKAAASSAVTALIRQNNLPMAAKVQNEFGLRLNLDLTMRIESQYSDDEARDLLSVALIKEQDSPLAPKAALLLAQTGLTDETRPLIMAVYERTEDEVFKEMLEPYVRNQMS